MDLEQICLLCAILLFAVGFGLLILLTIPQSYSSLHLGFWHFVVSLILLSASGIVLAVRQFYIWPSEGYSLEKWGTLYTPASLETPNIKDQTTVKTKKTKPQRHKSEIVDPPTREQLDKLKELLGIEKGSLQFKKRGQGIYLVTYEHRKHHWNHVGSWIELKEKLGEKISSN